MLIPEVLIDKENRENLTSAQWTSHASVQLGKERTAEFSTHDQQLQSVQAENKLGQEYAHPWIGGAYFELSLHVYNSELHFLIRKDYESKERNIHQSDQIREVPL